MKSFSFKILYISLFMPSLLFLLTLPALENSIRKSLTQTIHRQLIQSHTEILEGKANLYNEINTNVTKSLGKSMAVRLGTQAHVRVRDASGNILYPFYDRLLSSMQEEKQPSLAPGPLFDNRGFLKKEPGGLEDLLQKYSHFLEGVRVEVRVAIPVTSWLGSVTLLFYILLTVFTLFLYYQRSRRLEEKNIQKITSEFQHRLEREKEDYSQELDARLAMAHNRLNEIKNQEEEWLREVERLEKEKSGLEEELLESMEQSEEQQEKLHLLEEEVAKKTDQQAKADAKEQSSLGERFTKLYPNLEIDQTAIKGVIHLRDNKSKLQAEEMLKRLNDSDPNLKVRRKIAGVAGCDALELGFGAKGRIYYLPLAGKHCRVLRVGTKTTQNKDLAALEGLSA